MARKKIVSEDEMKCNRCLTSPWCRCRKILSFEEYEMLKRAFYMKEENLEKIRKI